MKWNQVKLTRGKRPRGIKIPKKQIPKKNMQNEASRLPSGRGIKPKRMNYLDASIRDIKLQKNKFQIPKK
jgi:hypothetical protein